MNIETYGEYQLRLIPDLGTYKQNLVHMALGVGGEAGEVVDLCKKHFAYDKPLDVAHLVEELGDLLFYMNGIRALIEVEWEDIIDTNVRKLEARYPDATFKAEHAINRDKVAEKAAMEGL